VASDGSREAAVRFHDVGEVWAGPTRLAQVQYQLRAVQGAAVDSTGALAEQPAVSGTLLPLRGDWNALHDRRGLWLHLRDGRRLPIGVTIDAGSILHIRALGDFMSGDVAA